ncbi:MAG: undecaprenyl/decaprenyl-phosphate alpha-N-acetylglucosaminyl 1-phosphate transferase [Planctomycetaceae bacterium]|nr:undecaprenyl/decaprenyl-phosphate alpha-N-acetylglucosaminyl 1-phosphate transferase [Planctomycetaceae bacterium]
MILVGLTFCAACVLSLMLVPLVARRCRAYGLVDHPDGHRKLHTQPAALAGGIASFIAVVLVVVAAAALNPQLARAFERESLFHVGLATSALVLLLTGVVDDLVGLRGRQKLAGQILSASILMASGLMISRVQLLGHVLDLGLLSAPLTLLWLLGAINAVNLLDGINGLAATLGITSAGALALMSQFGGHPAEAVIAAALAGSLLGFLRYNFPKATVFLGDAGSMLIGLMVGALSVQSSLKGPGTVLLATPVCLMAIPFFDSAAAIVRRKLTGRSIFSTDRAHLHHCLTDRFGNLAAVGVVAVGCGISAVAALSSLWWQKELLAVMSAVAVIVFFISTRIFGYSELRLLTTRLQSLASSMVSARRATPRDVKQSIVRLQGTREWNLLWAMLTEAAGELSLQHVELDVNAPSLREGYHAKWESATRIADEKLWRFEMPLIAVGHRVGHIRISAARTSSAASTEVGRLHDLLDELEDRLARMLRDAAMPAVAPAALNHDDVVESAVIAPGALSH